jgi:hypothetical protein
MLKGSSSVGIARVRSRTLLKKEESLKLGSWKKKFGGPPLKAT